MTITQALREFLKGCPLFDVKEDIRIEYPGIKPKSYGLASTGESVIRAYIDGSQEIEHAFVLYASNYTVTDAARLENSGFLESLGRWIREQAIKKAWPALDGGRTIRNITSAGGMLYNSEADGDKGTYQIQLQVTYYQRRT